MHCLLTCDHCFEGIRCYGMGEKVAEALQKLFEVYEKRPKMTLLLVFVVSVVAVYAVYGYIHKPVANDGSQQIKSDGDGNTNTNIR
jgi:hypothetical protein